MSSRISAHTSPASRMRRISSRDLRLILTPDASAWARGNPPADPWALRSGEALVVPRDEVRFDLLHGVERDTDDDQEVRAAELERHVQVLLQERRDHAHDGQVHRARERD